MDTRKATPAAALHPLWSAPNAWSGMLDLPRQQLATATHAACALFSGFEAMRRIQEEAAHEALKHYQAAAERLDKGCSPLDMLSVQMDLANFDSNAAAAYWQQLANTAMQMQGRIAACGCELVDSDKVLEACAMFEPH